MNRDYYKQCKICNKEFTNPTDFHRHLKGHSIKVDAYLSKYELDGINPTCKCGCGSPTNFDARKGELERGYFRDYVNGHYGKHVQSKEKVVKPPKFKYEPFECKLCDHVSHKPVDFRKHILEEHGLEFRDYIIQHQCQGVQPLCKCGCGEPVKFVLENVLRFNNYHEEYIRNHRPKPKEDREHVAMRVALAKQAMIAKYGVDNASKLKSSIDKIKQTKLERYGDANYTNVEKQIETRKRLYGIKTKEEKEQARLEKISEKYRIARIKRLLKESSKKPKTVKPPKVYKTGNGEYVCGICNEKHTIHGFVTHLKVKHPEYSIDKYVEEFGEYRRRQIERFHRLSKTSLKCLLCNDDFVSDRELSYHVKVRHGLEKSDYVKNHIWKYQKPLCKCGCGNPVSMIDQFPYRRDYYARHTSGIRKPYVMTDSIRKALSRGFLKRLESKKPTKPELEFQKFLDDNCIEYTCQKPVGVGFVDFHLTKENIFIEIDGEYYHPNRKEDLTFTQMTNSIADLKKDKFIDIRLRANDVKKIKTLDDLFKYHVVYQKDIPYNQILLSSEYLEKFHKSDTVKYLLTRVDTVIKFVKSYFQIDMTESMKENVINMFMNCEDVTMNSIKGTV